MPLNKVLKKSNMYPWVNATINFIKGQCEHNCVYCYYQSNSRFKSRIGKIRLDEKEFKTNLGRNNIIFVGSSTDMFARSIPFVWIEKVLKYCSKYYNKYLFQSKNPARFMEFIDQFPKKSILGTTIESNRDHLVSNAPKINQRVEGMMAINNFPKMISIEPVLDFDPDILIPWIKEINPIFVSIGADSKKNDLPEPSALKLRYLIKKLKKITNIKIKHNLNRLMK